LRCYALIAQVIQLSNDHDILCNDILIYVF
jgi:hypothetical protein